MRVFLCPRVCVCFVRGGYSREIPETLEGGRLVGMYQASKGPPSAVRMVRVREWFDTKISN